MKSNELTPKKRTKVFTVLSIITTIAASLWFIFLVYLAIQTLIDNANYVPGDNTMNSAGIGFALYVIFSAYELITKNKKLFLTDLYLNKSLNLYEFFYITTLNKLKSHFKDFIT